MEKISFESLSEDLLMRAAHILDYYYNFEPDNTNYKSIISEDGINEYLRNYETFNKTPLNYSDIDGKKAEDIFFSFFTKIISETKQGGLSLFVKIHHNDSTTCIASTGNGNNSECSKINYELKKEGNELLNKFVLAELFEMVGKDALEKTNEIIDQYNKKQGGKRNHQKRKSTKKKRRSTKNRSSRQ